MIKRENNILEDTTKSKRHGQKNLGPKKKKKLEENRRLGGREGTRKYISVSAEEKKKGRRTRRETKNSTTKICGKCPGAERGERKGGGPKILH